MNLQFCHPFWKLPIDYIKAIRDFSNDKFEKSSLDEFIFNPEPKKLTKIKLANLKEFKINNKNLHYVFGLGKLEMD